MDIENAIGKVRFSAARPQRVQLFRGDGMLFEMLCLEPEQEIDAPGPCAYYVVTGRARMAGDGEGFDLTAGTFAHVGPEEPHRLVNSGETRLICLAATPIS